MAMWRLKVMARISRSMIHFFREESKEVFLYDVIRKKKTKTQIDRKIPYGGSTLAIDKNSIYVIGGTHGGYIGQAQKQTWHFNMKTKNISDKKSMNKERKIFAITYDDNSKQIYVFGGLGIGGALNQCEKYYVEEDRWSVIKPMSKQKYGSSACIQNKEFIFVICGSINEYSFINDIEKYDIAIDSWRTISLKSTQQLSARFMAFSFQINKHSILIAGGYNQVDEGKLQDCYIYDTDKNVLKRASNMPEKDNFGSPTALICGSNLFMANICVSRDKFIYKYTIYNDKWNKFYRF